jgi:hypothetical protein
MSQFESFGIATSAMLSELSISCWTGRKLDKKVSEEVDTAKNTKGRAGNYHKHLMAGSAALDNVAKYAAGVRLWHNKRTLPWSDSGSRLITMAGFIEYKQQLTEHESNFNALVANFVTTYPTLISAAAFQLGELFNRDEYPEADEIARKFRFGYAFSPVPTAGDFRVDINEDAKRELVAQYEAHFNARIEGAMKDAWGRLHDCLTHMSDRLGAKDDGARKVFHGTMLTNAQELVELLGHLNITKDDKLEAARKALAATLLATDLSTLKESDEVRASTKTRVDEILSKFDW